MRKPGGLAHPGLFLYRRRRQTTTEASLTSFLHRLQELQEDLEALETDPGWMDEATASWTRNAIDVISACMMSPSPKRLAELRRMDYRTEYLQTPEWQATRANAIACAGHACSECGIRGIRTSNVPLDVHHLTYERIGDELGEDLIVLCRACHIQKHRADS